MTTTAKHEALLRRGILALALLGCGGAMSAACAVDDHVVLADDPDASPPPQAPFEVPAEAGVDATPTTPLALLCQGTLCPPPYATCGTTASVHCGTNLLTDVNNCGACGNVCPQTDPGTLPRCTNGKCAFDCRSVEGFCNRIDYKDCNALADDGCETSISSDAMNCGECGNVCPEGQECNMGSCGCPAGKTYCPACRREACVDVTADDDHCGDCQTRCPGFDPDGCNPMPANTYYGCAASTCGALKCIAFTGDCNNDLAQGCSSDGCEVDFRALDPKNCGRCGNACAADEECRDDANNGPQCLKKCAASGKSQCASGCVDFLSDPMNCGACNTECPFFGNDKAACLKGICTTECATGFGDCDGNPLNGCEVRLNDNPLHCGACGVSCNFTAGQPCIEGKCLMVECDAGGAIK